MDSLHEHFISNMVRQPEFLIELDDSDSTYIFILYF